MLGTLAAVDRGRARRCPGGRWNLLWVEQFPLFEHDEEAGRYVAIHHPFTAPNWDEVDKLDSAPGDVRSQAYDLVLNGTEIGGGSIRIHRRDVQDRVFRALAIDDVEADEKFGFLRRALDSGAPPHGGIALGFDRICAMLVGSGFDPRGHRLPQDHQRVLLDDRISGLGGPRAASRAGAENG